MGSWFIKECQDCGIIWRSEASFDLEQLYNEQYFDSKNYAANRPHKVEKSVWLLDLALSINPDIKSILEVGCSLGNTLEAASRKRLDHLGIDVSSFAVEFCHKKGLNASNETLEQLVDQVRSFVLFSCNMYWSISRTHLRYSDSAINCCLPRDWS